MKNNKDAQGNERSPNQYEVTDGLLHVSYTYKLEAGKTTLRGTYPKLDERICVHPERLDCNGGEGYYRCEYMKCSGGLYNPSWRCTVKG